MPTHHDPLGEQPSIDIVEFFNLCAQGVRIPVAFPSLPLARRFRARLNSVRKKLMDQGQYPEWAIVEVVLREDTSAINAPTFQVIGQIRDDDYADALTAALQSARKRLAEAQRYVASPHDSVSGEDDISGILTRSGFISGAGSTAVSGAASGTDEDRSPVASRAASGSVGATVGATPTERTSNDVPPTDGSSSNVTPTDPNRK